MNITPQATNLSIPTVLNPHTETLRRENNQREVITQPAALAQSAAEKGVSTDKERGKTPAQNSENIDFISLKEKAELANNTLSEKNNEKNNEQKQEPNQEHNDEQSTQHTDEQHDSENNNDSDPIDEFQQAREISKLKQRDQEVRSHELAHAAVGGAHTGSPSYSFETGPDGKKYAVEGEVSIDLSSIAGDPKATIAKMQKVHAAALAPANPSVQDTRVAATAAQIILQAQSEILQQQGVEFDTRASENAPYVKPNQTLANDEQSLQNDHITAQSFDQFINQTLKSQETIAPAQPTLSQTKEVQQRAGRIEHFYSAITQAYEKPVSHQFELLA